MNELVLIFDWVGIDSNDVLGVAVSNWNFLGFKPGLFGGHPFFIEGLGIFVLEYLEKFPAEDS